MCPHCYYLNYEQDPLIITKTDFSPECSFSAKSKYKNKKQSQYEYIDEYVVAVIMIFTPIMNLYFLLLCFSQTPEASGGK